MYSIRCHWILQLLHGHRCLHQSMLLLYMVADAEFVLMQVNAEIGNMEVARDQFLYLSLSSMLQILLF